MMDRGFSGNRGRRGNRGRGRGRFRGRGGEGGSRRPVLIPLPRERSQAYGDSEGSAGGSKEAFGLSCDLPRLNAAMAKISEVSRERLDSAVGVREVSGRVALQLATLEAYFDALTKLVAREVCPLLPHFHPGMPAVSIGKIDEMLHNVAAIEDIARSLDQAVLRRITCDETTLVEEEKAPLVGGREKMNLFLAGVCFVSPLIMWMISERTIL